MLLEAVDVATGMRRVYLAGCVRRWEPVVLDHRADLPQRLVASCG